MNSQARPGSPAHSVLGWREGRTPFGDASLATYASGRSDAGAPVVLFVHGMGHWTQAAWDGIARQLGATHRCIAFDLPGFGASDRPKAAYTLAYFQAALRCVVAGAGLERFSLVGHSLGGLIAADYAAREGSRVRLLALIDPAGFLRTSSFVLRVAASRPVTSVLGRLRPSRRFVRRTLTSAVYNPASVPETMHERAFALSQDPALVRAFASVYAGAMHELLHLDALHERLAAWHGSTLLVWGREDRYIPVRALTVARSVYPQADVLELPKCGHCPNIEAPAIVTARLLANGV